MVSKVTRLRQHPSFGPNASYTWYASFQRCVVAGGMRLVSRDLD